MAVRQHHRRHSMVHGRGWHAARQEHGVWHLGSRSQRPPGEAQSSGISSRTRVSTRYPTLLALRSNRRVATGAAAALAPPGAASPLGLWCCSVTVLPSICVLGHEVGENGGVRWACFPGARLASGSILNRNSQHVTDSLHGGSVFACACARGRPCRWGRSACPVGAHGSRGW